MVTLMEHPIHGLHPAIGLEVEELEKNGWVKKQNSTSPAEALSSPQIEGEVAAKNVVTRRSKSPKN